MAVAGTAALAVVSLVVALAFGIERVSAFFQFLVDWWILQALFGAWIVHSFQAANAKAARRMSSLEAAYTRKVEATKRLHSLIQRRIYATRQYLAVIATEPDKIDKERELYRAVVAEWSTEAPTQQAVIILEFGYVKGASLDRDVFPVFAEIDKLARSQRLRVQAGKPLSLKTMNLIRQKLNGLSNYAISLNTELIGRANRDRNLLDGKIPIAHENHAHLGYFQIIKSLVKLPE